MSFIDFLILTLILTTLAGITEYAIDLYILEYENDEDSDWQLRLLFGDFHEVKVCLLSISLIISLRIWLNHLRKIKLVHKVKNMSDADIHKHLKHFRSKD